MANARRMEKFYFRIIDEEDETNASHERNSVSPIDSSLNEMDIDDICSSVVDNDNSYPLESPVEIVLVENSNTDNSVSPIDSSLNEVDIDDICLSVVDNDNSYPFESPVEIVLVENSNVNNSVSPIDSSLNEMDIDNICLSVVDNDNSYTFECPVEVVLVENSNINHGAQDCDIVDLSDDDENAETIPIEDPIVNITGIHMITMSEDQKRKFPTHNVHIFDTLINYLRDKTQRYVVNSQSNSGYELQVRHLMDLLTPNSWLTDTVIQNYMSLLAVNCKNSLAINTDLLSCYERRGYKSVNKWFNSSDLINVHYVFMPINPGKNHWALFIIEIWRGIIYFYDSFKDTDIEKEFELVSDFCDKALVDCLIKNSNVKRALPTNWSYTNCSSPAQFNNTDCGVFTCMNAKNFIFALEPKFTQEDIPICRQTIAWELIHNCIKLHSCNELL